MNGNEKEHENETWAAAPVPAGSRRRKTMTTRKFAMEVYELLDGNLRFDGQEIDNGVVYDQEDGFYAVRQSDCCSSDRVWDGGLDFTEFGPLSEADAIAFAAAENINS